MIVDINANKSFSERLEEHMATDPKCIHNKALEESPEYQKIIPEVMKEVYTHFIEKELPILEKDVRKSKNRESHSSFVNKMFQVKLFISQGNLKGACDLLCGWGYMSERHELQQRILKEKYGITWYTPQECFPFFTCE